MRSREVFHRVIDALDRAGIPYMLTGSFAGSFYGAPRATQDIDVVIAPTATQMRSLLSILTGPEYYVSEEAAFDAVEREGQFNVIDLTTGWKIDLIIRKSRPFSREEFDRRDRVDFQEMKMSIATAEDMVIAKLEWAKIGGSERQIEDVAGILKIRQLDVLYIRRWVEDLGLTEQWRSACRIAGTGT